MIDLNNKVAIVTGGGRGQGAATARLFAEAGARVIICEVLDEEGQALAAEIGEAAIYRHLDVSRGDQWAAVVEEAEQGGAGVDILINNAAIGDSTPLLDVKPEMLQRLLNVNVTGTYIGMQAVLPTMRERGGGQCTIRGSSTCAEGRLCKATMSFLLNVTFSPRMADMRLGKLLNLI